MSKEIINLKGKDNCNIEIWFYLAVILISSSCKKLVETPPPTSNITEANVFSTDATAIATINNLYIGMNSVEHSNPIQGARSISLLTGISADEYTLFSGVTGIEFVHYYENALSGTLRTGSDKWAPLYNYVFKCNAAIEAFTSEKSNALTVNVKRQLLGEAQMLRAYFYFNLVNMFGEIPLCLVTDPQVNTSLARSSKDLVYQQIIADLQSAEENLSNDYLNGDLSSVTIERVRPTKWAAIALLARVYLYIEDWENAEAKATQIINYISLFGPLPSLNNVFLKNSREAIWQLQPTSIDFNTTEAQTLILPASGSNIYNNPVYLSDALLSSFEDDDERVVNGNWINSVTVSGTSYFYPYKYKVSNSPGVTDASGMTEYFMMLRLGEQYLIRAEARTQLNNIGGAQTDLNAIRNRAGLSNTSAFDRVSLLTAIMIERQHELFTEGAHRWFDLKRTGDVDSVMTSVTPLKSGGSTIWESYQQLYPIPESELQKAPNLTQNPGY
ncbi:RagB/SusD family nutrient uptake outer membrane protein [Longitalea luteola]|uniref:RagB/SusD family nutrient uptake outer membrane protein n=1 Tax=Longitalea luteola TaxID=2812563 RepID=UPI001A958DC7|nr:RagB/SusD family nutrient uptake outer membrane protein [Longitalea luteola]